MDAQQSVLIVDCSEETREVLQTALERHGLRTFAACEARQGIALARKHHPDLIVLDLELDNSAPDTLSAPFAEQSRSDGAPLVLLGSVRRRNPPAPQKPPPEGEFFAKPYHYGPLIRRIEELLEAGRVVAVRDSRERSGHALRAG